MNYEKELENINKLCQKAMEKQEQVCETAQKELEGLKNRVAYLAKVQERTGKFRVSVHA